MRRVAVISLHTSPLLQPGSGDSGGMNVYVREMVSSLAQAGLECTTYTRCDRVGLPREVLVEPNHTVVHVEAGPHHLPKEALADVLDTFTAGVLDHITRNGGADVVHANYWLSGVVAHRIKHALDIPFVSTFHTLARVKAEGGDFDRLFADGERVPLGEFEIEVMATPGHTPACVSYRIGDAVFVGDTLFMPDYGTARTDFPGGDAATLYRSIRRLLSLPRETRLFMCHDYKAPGRSEFAWETNVGEELDRNVHVGGGVAQQAFVEMREGRDATLSVPRLLYPAIQVNIRAGRLPPAEADGSRFLRIPLSPN